MNRFERRVRDLETAAPAGLIDLGRERARWEGHRLELAGLAGAGPAAGAAAFARAFGFVALANAAATRAGVGGRDLDAARRWPGAVLELGRALGREAAGALLASPRAIPGGGPGAWLPAWAVAVARLQSRVPPGAGAAVRAVADRCAAMGTGLVAVQGVRKLKLPIHNKLCALSGCN